MVIVAISNIQRLLLASVAKQAEFHQTAWSYEIV